MQHIIRSLKKKKCISMAVATTEDTGVVLVFLMGILGVLANWVLTHFSCRFKCFYYFYQDLIFLQHGEGFDLQVGKSNRFLFTSL